MNDAPIACSLTAGDMAGRETQFDELARDALLARRDLPDGVRVRLRHTPDIERRTRELIAAEERCCPFLTFHVRRHDSEMELDITGPKPARPIIDEFFEAPDRR
jgi:MerR family transcriptional regulator, copper efflux regulator